MTVDTFSRRALLAAKQDGGTYAPRHRVWPPEGYVAPTAEEFAELKQAAHRYASGWMFRSTWDRMTDDTLVRQLQLLELLPRTDARTDREVYDYAHELRREMSRRKRVHRSIALLRCEACTHGTERLFEATQTTHPGLENASGNAVESAWFCARCWSGERGTDDETEGEW